MLKTAEEIDNLSASTNEKVQEVLNKIQKTRVAPEEKGKFQNRGEDVFFRRKVLPRLISLWSWQLPQFNC